MSSSTESGLPTVPSFAATSDEVPEDAVWVDCRDDLDEQGIHPFFEEDTWHPDLPDNVTDVVTVLADLVEASLKAETDKGTQ